MPTAGKKVGNKNEKKAVVRLHKEVKTLKKDIRVLKSKAKAPRK